MPLDLVFPEGNEQKLAQMASRLGYTELLLCYPLHDPLLKERKKEAEKLTSDALAVGFAVLVKNQNDAGKASGLTKHVVGIARPELFDDRRVRFLINAESGRREDFIHHRNSGLTQVFLNAAIKKEKTILVNFNQLIDKKASPGVVLGRMLQNNTFYRKYPARVRVVSGARNALEMRAPRDLENFTQL